MTTAGVREVVIVGGRGFGKTLLGNLASDSRYRVVAILDDGLAEDRLLGVPRLPLLEYRGSCRTALLAIGYPDDKLAILEATAHLGLAWETYIHPSALVSPYARIGSGSIVSPYAQVSADAVIGRHVTLHGYAAVGHDAVVGDYVSILPRGTVSGTLGERAIVTVGAAVLDDGELGVASVAGPYTVIRRRVPDGKLAYGMPLRIVRRQTRLREC